MSGPERSPESPVPTTSLKRKHFSDEDQAELEKLDSAFKRIKKAIPRAPYILSTPSLHPYAYHSRHEERAWMLGHLFKPDEEHLQYRTFLFREPYQDCFTLQHGEDDEPEMPRPKSQASLPSSQVAKKKISLSDYKSKQANGIITPGSKKISPSLPPTKTAPAQANGVNPPASSPQKQDEAKPDKHPAPESLPRKPEKSAEEDLAVRPPVQPLKTESAESRIDLDKAGPSNSTPHGLPPLLSPVDTLSNPYGLPTILSPTLPSNIQAELDKIETQRKRADSNASTSSSDRKGQTLPIPEPRPPKPDQDSKANSRVRSVSRNGNSPLGGTLNRSEGSEPSLIVKLKYTKKSRETIKRLLSLPPKRDASGDRNERDASKDRATQSQAKAVDGAGPKQKPIPKVAARRPDASTVTPKPPTVVSKLAEKRPRSEDDVSQSLPSKRPRAQSLHDGPNTPKGQILTSPALSNKSSAQKSQGPYATPTPRKEHKGIGMLRTASAESHDVTPGRSGTTPTGVKHLDVKAPTSVPLNNKKQGDIALLQNYSQKLNSMGRTLKHEGQKLEGGKGKDDRRRASVIGLECLLSYMAAYHAQDLAFHLRGRAAEVENTWKTLLPLCFSYSRLTKDFQHLDGFRSYLGAVIAANICTLLAPRAPNPKAHDSPHELSQAELAKQNSHLMENFSLLADHYLRLLRHLQDARIALPAAEIQKTYPKTWSGAETNTTLVKVPEKVNATKLSGPYFLPIQSDTTPIQAVRFGLRFLSEYCEKEQIDYTLRINLDKPE